MSCYYCIYGYDNYRKENEGGVYGIFTDLDNANDSFAKILKTLNCRKKNEDDEETEENCFLIENEDLTINDGWTFKKSDINKNIQVLRKAYDQENYSFYLYLICQNC
jgi:hypothetical protein